MKSFKSIVRDESGSTLVIVMIIAIVMLITTVAVMELGAQDAALAMRDVRTSQALYLAEAGAERTQAWLQDQSSRPTTAVNPFGDFAEGAGDGLYFTTLTPKTGVVRPIFIVTSVATVDGHTCAIETEMTPRSFMDYLYFTNLGVGPAGPGYFRSGDVVDGPIHINDQLAIWGDPVFKDRIESTNTLIRYENNSSPIDLAALSNPPFDEPVFEKGCVLGAPHMPWLAQPDINELKLLAELSISNAEIVLGRDDGSGPMLGWFSWRKTGTTDPWNDVDISSFNGIVYVNGDCWVSGILDGQLTISCNADILIVDDVVYADSDENGPREGCDDLLGLAASVRTSVADNVPNGNDCVIHAHLLACNNQSGLVENYSQGTPRGTLTIYGGLAQDKWGATGTGYYDGDGVFHLLTGYERDLHYDYRLRDILPPGYSAIMYPGFAYERMTWREITPPFELSEGFMYPLGG